MSETPLPPSLLCDGIQLISGRHIQAAFCNTKGFGMPYLTGPEDFPSGRIQATKYVSRPDAVCEAGDILLVVKGSGTGKAIRADKRYCISRQLMAIRSTVWSNNYLQHFIGALEEYFRYAAAGLIPGISRVDILQAPAQVQPLPQQRKIARILTTLDNLIEKTESLIAKYQSIKQGMMADLFTRGVDANGKLRPPQSAAPELYKQSELGWIPKEWEVRRLDELYANPIRDFGSFSSTNLITFLDSGVPFIKSEMVENGNVNWSSVTYISEQVHQLLDKSYVHKDHILFSKIGSALGNGVVYDGSRGVCNSNAAVAKIDIDNRVAGRHFVTYFLNHDIAKNQLRNMIVSLLPRINLGDLSSLLIPTPAIEEQRRIEKRFLALDKAIKSERATLNHLIEIKTGLMQDLLTGKVPVKPDESEEAA